MKDKGGKSAWPRWHDLIDLIMMPYVGAIICMIIAPLYVFSKKVRIEIDNDGATGGLTILVFIWIGIILWFIGLFIGTITLLDTFSA